MGAKFLLSAAVIAVSLSFTSCSKSSEEEVVLSSRSSDEIVSATVVAGSAYELPLSQYGSVTIQSQPGHYAESFAGTDSKTGLLIYKYVPAPDFTGEDRVVLKTSKTVQDYSGGGCNMDGSNAYTYDRQVTNFITVKFKVVK